MTGLRTILLMCIAALTWWPSAAQEPAAIPVVFTYDGHTLAAIKKRLQSNKAKLIPAYRQLVINAGKALTFGPVSVMEKKNIPPSGDKHDYMSLAPYHWPDPAKPDGLPYIRKDGQTNPEVKEYKDKEYLPQLCDKVFTLSLAYYYSGEKKYAEHAARLIRVWFLDTATKMNPNLNFGQAMKGTNTGRGAGLIDGRHMIKVIDAAGLLQSGSYWSAADQEGLKKWFSEFMTWMQTSKNGTDEMNAPNNHGAWYDALRLSISVYINDTAQARKIIASAQSRLDKQMNAAGDFPLEMARTTSLHYSVFVMDAFCTIAHLSGKAGVDFWNYKSPAGNSLKKGFDRLLPYLAKQKKWEGQQIKEFDFDEGIPLLAQGRLYFGCKKCPKLLRNLAGDQSPALLIHLLY